MKDVYHEVSIERYKGEKITSRLPHESEFMEFSQENIIKSNFDYFFAIDTNTKYFNGIKLSIVVIVQFWRESNHNGDTIWNSKFFQAIEVVNVKGENPENLGWALAIERLEAFFSGRVPRILLVVDSDLSNLKKYNLRERAFFDGKFLLPAHIKFAYASSDKRNDGLLNFMISSADRIGNEIFLNIESGKIARNSEFIESPYYEGYRIFEPK